MMALARLRSSTVMAHQAILDSGVLYGGVHWVVEVDDLDLAEGCADEAELRGGVGEENRLGDEVGIGTTFDQVLGHAEGGCGDAGVGEGAGIGEEGGVEAGSHGGAHADAGGEGEVVDHGTDGGCFGIDPVEAGEVAAAGMVVDVDGRRRGGWLRTRRS